MSRRPIENLERPIAEIVPGQVEAAAGGAYSLPEVGDQVLVSFQPAGTRKPYVLGSLWSGSDSPTS